MLVVSYPVVPSMLHPIHYRAKPRSLRAVFGSGAPICRGYCRFGRPRDAVPAGAAAPRWASAVNGGRVRGGLRVCPVTARSPPGPGLATRPDLWGLWPCRAGRVRRAALQERYRGNGGRNDPLPTQPPLPFARGRRGARAAQRILKVTKLRLSGLGLMTFFSALPARSTARMRAVQVPGGKRPARRKVQAVVPRALV